MIRPRESPNIGDAPITVKEDGMKALALVDAPDHVCCRYRIGAFATAMRASGWDLTLQSLSRGLAGRLAQIARAGRFDTVIVQRKLLPRWQIHALRRRSKRLVFDFDDAVLYRDSYDPRGPFCPRRASRFADVVGLADAVIAGNDFLAACALDAGANPDRVRVIPTCINIDRYRPSAGDETGPGLVLVWIGSSSTLQGLELQRPLWERIARAVPGVRLRVICDRFPDLGPMPVFAVPWSEATEAGALATGDVGISWIPDDLWSRGKCGLKVLQYQASGLPVLANPVGVHPTLIDHGNTGLLADHPDAWVESVRQLAADPPGRRRMGASARAAVVADYSVAAWEATFVAAIGGGGRVPVRPPSTRGTPRRNVAPRSRAGAGPGTSSGTSPSKVGRS
jgi:glycosyltransferase involved in cell wall biosynthesis